jgi:hypothetical protein
MLPPLRLLSTEVVGNFRLEIGRDSEFILDLVLHGDMVWHTLNSELVLVENEVVVKSEAKCYELIVFSFVRFVIFSPTDIALMGKLL